MGAECKIALVVPWLEVGGVETFLFALACGLKNEGCDVEIVATEEPGPWFPRAAQLGIAACCLPVRQSYSMAGHARNVARYLRRRAFAVCLLNHARLAQAALAMLPDEVVVVPIIHNDEEQVYQVGCANSDSWNVAVAVSPRVCRETQRRVPHKPVWEITYGVSLPSPSADRRRRNRAGLLEIVFVGRLTHPQKGIFFLPEIMQACVAKGVEYRLTIIGDGPDRSALKDRLSAAGVAGTTRMTGFVPPEQVAMHLQSADALLMPSLYEGLGLVMLEASAQGCVPVCSRLPGVTDTAIEDGQSGFLVERGDIHGFARCLELLYRDRARLGAMSMAARARAEQRFPFGRMVARYLELLQHSLRGDFALARRRSDLPALDPRLIRRRDHVPRRVASVAGSLLRSLGRTT